MKRKMMAIVVVVILVLGSVISVSASNEEEVVAYNLEKGGKQIFYLENSEGNIDKVIVEKISGDERVVDNNYKITYETLNWTAGFYIKVQRDRIISAYSPFYSVLMGNIQSASLVRNSDIKATYAFLYRMTVWSDDTGVIAKISDGEIKVSKR